MIPKSCLDSLLVEAQYLPVGQDCQVTVGTWTMKNRFALWPGFSIILAPVNRHIATALVLSLGGVGS